MVVAAKHSAMQDAMRIVRSADVVQKLDGVGIQTRIVLLQMVVKVVVRRHQTLPIQLNLLLLDLMDGVVRILAALLAMQKVLMEGAALRLDGVAARHSTA